MRVDLRGFEHKYRAERDPWGFASNPYEQRKYAISVASLPSGRYRRCFEPGCSIGALTQRLARVADRVIAWDASASAVATARDRLAPEKNVEIECAAIPEQWPVGSFDLIVFSEIGYYWDEVDLEPIIEQAHDSLEVGGHLLAVHWLGHSPDHMLHGTTVHTALARVVSETHHPSRRVRLHPGDLGEGLSVSLAAPIHAVVIAVPARDEADRIAACLEAVLVSADLMPPGVTRSVVVSCDSCADATVEVVRRFAERFPIVHSVEGTWGSAGGARRAALHFGVGSLANGGFTSWSTVWLATTDADSQVAADWLPRQLHYASRGADAVAGTVDLIDDPDRSPEVAEIFRRIYELGRDSHPHVHAANLGVRASAYFALGGFSDVEVAEDHTLWNALRRHRFHCVSPLDVRVSTSARLRARAPGGFGDTLGAVLADETETRRGGE